MIGSKISVKALAMEVLVALVLFILLMVFVYGPDTVLEVLHVLHHFIFTTFQGRYYYYLCFADKEQRQLEVE